MSSSIPHTSEHGDLILARHQHKIKPATTLPVRKITSAAMSELIGVGRIEVFNRVRKLSGRTILFEQERAPVSFAIDLPWLKAVMLTDE
ncbi:MULTISPECIES: hypothetical protein [unclassified Phyllobacterium]|uniref:hypothetical protein n=1 Tax=unclassified Phyllobacterium TaxID=2638441 RepID=UPI003012A60D